MAEPEAPFKRPQTVGGVVYLAVLAAGTRLVLSERGAGMLRVRRRWSDVLMLTVAGVALIVLAIVVPNQTGA